MILPPLPPKLGWIVLILALTGSQLTAPSPQAEFFETKIRPLLHRHCYNCHDQTATAGLRLDSRAGLLRGGQSGPAAVPGKVDSSLLVQAIRYQHDVKMPPSGALPNEEVEALERWISEGMFWPAHRLFTLPQYGFSDAYRSHWAFQPLDNGPVPLAPEGTQAANAIDHFLLARLADEKLSPSPLAARRKLLRRVTYDLTGLPPSLRETEMFLGDASPAAYTKLVDRLLASPAYGERWGQHWLDVVRYADTTGNSADYPVPEAYKYRNYVIDAFQHDKPYNQFVREQIAGDLLDTDSDEERWERIVATGYLAIARRVGSRPENTKHIMIEDVIDNFGKTFLGLSIQCARCHDHKFDPIPTTDYYALYGILNSSVFPHPGSEYRLPRYNFVYRVGQRKAATVLASYEKELAGWNAKERKKYEEYISFQKRRITEPGRSQEIVWQELRTLRAERADFARTEPALETAYAVQDGEIRDAAIHLGGDPRTKGHVIRRGFLQILGGAQVPRNYQGSGRRLLADWIADPHNPLTARVMANRIWHYHFGVGLVRTTSDFGLRGARPTHQRLLDFLTRYFIDSGWSVKALHRLILHSHAYRQASLDIPANHERDPQNRLLWKANRRPLDAEQIRDSILAFSGQLDRSRGGRHPFRHRRTYFYTVHEPFSESFPTRRRSVYMMRARLQSPQFFSLFNNPDGNLPLSERSKSTTAAQALWLMNSRFMHEQTRMIAAYWSTESVGAAHFLNKASRNIFGRASRPEEINLLSSFSSGMAGKGLGKRAGFLRAMLASNEFLFLD